ncbi:PAP2 superfamily protein [Oscillospiraceae bacterium]|nr:PAP2 superfamily protein [Oscillospiraceae bacterium]
MRRTDPLYLLLFVLFGAGLITGMFFDLEISSTLYSKDNTLAVIMSVIGLYLHYGSFVFFLGVLGKQLSLWAPKRAFKILVLLIYSYLALSTSTYGAGALMSDSVCGFLYKGASHTISSYAVAGLYLFFPLFFLGAFINGKKCDKKVIKDLIILLSLMTVALFFSWTVKSIFMRPRYRITLLGYEGIGFVQCFDIFREGKVLKDACHLVSDDLASFYSGHAMNAVMGIVIMPCYAHVFSGLRGKEKTLSVLAVIISIPVMLSRIVLGDHYLSDISTGALVGLLICTLYCGLNVKFISGKSQN